MTIGELMAIARTMDPDHDVYVALFRADGSGEVFDIEAVQDHHGDAQLDIYIDAEAFDEEDGNGAVSQDAAAGTPDAAEIAAEAFLEFCERRGITEEEKDLIWNAMAFMCYEQVQRRQGPFYEAMRPFLADGEP